MKKRLSLKKHRKFRTKHKGDDEITPDVTKPDSFHSLLQGYQIDELKALATLLTDTPPESKDILIGYIIEQLSKPEIVIPLWEDLDSLQKNAVAETLYSPFGFFPGTRFRAKYGNDPDWGETSPGKKIKNPTKLCLFIYKLHIPAELKQLLTHFVSQPEKTIINVLRELPLYWYIHDGREPADSLKGDRSPVIPDNRINPVKKSNKKVFSINTEYAVMHELPALLHGCAQKKIGAHPSTDRLSRAGENYVAHLLFGGEYYQESGLSSRGSKKMYTIKTQGWITLLSHLSYIRVEDALFTLTEKGKQLRDMPYYEGVKQIWEEWLAYEKFDELKRIDTIKGQQGKGAKYLTPVPERRKICARALSTCPRQVWINVDDLLAFMAAHGHIFYITTFPETLYIIDPRIGHMGYLESDDWNILDIRYAFVFFFEFMATLGLLDIGYIHPAGSRQDYRHVWGSDALPYISHYDGLLFIRVNNLGDYCLGKESAGTPVSYTRTPLKKSTDITILANLEIVATQPLQQQDIYVLNMFALRKSENVWELNQSKITESIEQGYDVCIFIEFLHAKSSGEVPENVELFLSEIVSKQEALSITGKAWIIKAKTPELAALIARHRALVSYCMITDDMTIVVPFEAKKEFLKVIHDLGYSLPMQDMI